MMTKANSRGFMRALFLSLAVSMLGVGSLSQASSSTYTTFEALSEGCSGGGDVCGTFPLVPSGTAEYSHAAGSDGSVDLEAATQGGLPLDQCLPLACPPSQYHAEALGTVWVDVPTGSTPAVSIMASYVLDEVVEENDATIGSAVASVTGAVAVLPAPGSAAPTCSDGSDVVGLRTDSISGESVEGAHTFGTTIECAYGGNLSATIWRVEMSITVGTTSAGGSATAAADAQLVSVEVGTP